MSGGLMRFCAHWSQLYMCRSVPQTEATLTFTSTSSGPICGTGICRTSAPGAASGFTTASMVSDIQFLVWRDERGKLVILTNGSTMDFSSWHAVVSQFEEDHFHLSS